MSGIEPGLAENKGNAPLYYFYKPDCFFFGRSGNVIHCVVSHKHS